MIFIYLNIAISIIYFLFVRDRFLGARFMSMFFIFLLFGLSPLLENNLGIYYYGSTPLSVDSFNIAAIATSFFTLLIFGSSIFSSKKIQEINLRVASKQILMLFPLLAMLLVIGYDYNFSYFLVRDGLWTDETTTDPNMITWLLVDRFLKPLIGIGAFLIIRYGSSKSHKILAVLWLLILCFPSSMTRAGVAIVYMPFLVWFLRNKNGGIKNIYILFVIFLVFAVLDGLRNESRINEFEFLSLVSGVFLHGHLDSYQSLQRVIEYDIVTSGKQLLGAFLFFVPRSLWIEKPIGSGGLVANLTGLNWENVSLNFLGEGYINFSYLGIVIFSLIYMLLVNYLDRPVSKTTMKMLASTYFPASLFFLLRGDLINGFGVMAGLFFALYVYKMFGLVKISIGVRDEHKPTSE